MTAQELQFDASVPPERRPVVDELLVEFGAAGLVPPLRVRLLPGGACNENFTVEAADGQRYVLHVAGLETRRFAFDRSRGVEAHRSAAAAGVSPEILAVKLPEGHSLIRWVDGPILTPEGLRAPGMLAAVGRTLRELHEGPAIDGSWSAFDDVRAYAETSRSDGRPLPDDLDELLERMEEAEAVFSTLEIEARMCHNDLQLQNLIIGDERLWVVDFEFAGMANPYFDLGNLAVNGELSDRELVDLIAAYAHESSEAQVARVRLMMFVAALREAMFAEVSNGVIQLTGWDWDAWAAEYYRRSRAWSAGCPFAYALAMAAGPNRDLE
jgi:thiamine kinase-like enzyme